MPRFDLNFRRKPLAKVWILFLGALCVCPRKTLFSACNCSAPLAGWQFFVIFDQKKGFILQKPGGRWVFGCFLAPGHLLPWFSCQMLPWLAWCWPKTGGKGRFVFGARRAEKRETPFYITGFAVPGLTKRTASFNLLAF